MVKILNNIVSAFFPATCLGCASKLIQHEQHICTHCRHNLPFTSYHKHPENPVLQSFYGRVLLENATALVHYKKNGIVQHLLHQLKYKGQQEVGVILGNILGNDLKNEPSYQTITHVIPVPLHKKRLKERGYNQVATFGKQLALQLNATYADTILIKINNTKTQAFKNRAERWTTIQDSFEIKNAELLTDAHILLVDDVITTGATLEACANALKKIPNIKISIATMSIAS
ncbi:ComF family protein [Kordia jejudonensis]|uniref:ComF family protein n=1 Tax=Kordia jejudonensis TaxID=1348245 RepID=UPI000AA1330D|nr:phosphoribosyltransferase family protein [Kordia jejudonensis]